MIVRRVLTDPGHSDPECLADRKWWCFLLSSILSFIVGVFSVLFIRACAAVCCRKVVDYNPPDQKKQVEGEKRSEAVQVARIKNVKNSKSSFARQCRWG